MKWRPCCVWGMRGEREKKCTDSGNAWDLTSASAFPTCGRWQRWPPGRGRESRPSATCARPQGWQQRSGCQQNDGRSRQRWEGCIRKRASKRKRGPPLLRRRGLSRSWRRASGMRRCERAFWPGYRFKGYCSSRRLNAQSTTSVFRDLIGFATGLLQAEESSWATWPGGTENRYCKVLRLLPSSSIMKEIKYYVRIFFLKGSY